MFPVLALLALPALACPDYAHEPALLRELEASASRGVLTEDEKRCLEQNFSVATEQTTKNKISRVELVNAYAYDTKSWADLVRRHLDEVDRSDPDMAYLWAFYLFNTDKSSSDQVVKWCDTALERKQVWEGDVFVSRVYGLMKLRTVAAHEKWKQAEEARAAGSGPTDDEIESLRNRTKTFAREWIDFAKVSGRNVNESLALCIAVASREACGEASNELFAPPAP
jgi:hypothetical protein